jgi:molybdopterin biosynthesis enzyme
VEPGRRSGSGVLYSLDHARDLLLKAIKPVAPHLTLSAEALGGICAEAVITCSQPARPIALRDGWAMRSDDLEGASSYAPALLAQQPTFVETGDVLPTDCDCVIERHGLDLSGPTPQALIEALPGENVRRPGEGAAAGAVLFAAGHRLRVTDLACLKALGLEHVMVRRPHVAILDAPARDGARTTSEFMQRALGLAGARASVFVCADRSACAIQSALETITADLIVLVGGTGAGASDHALAALEFCGAVHVHGIALDPGRTSAIGAVAGTPVIAIPALFEQALGAWLGLITPALHQLTNHQAAQPMRLPLTQKIASRVGVAEVALLRRRGATLTPLAIGDLPLQSLCAATHMTLIEAGSEGHASGEPIDAFPLPGMEAGP